jgi:hypothetical protein
MKAKSAVTIRRPLEEVSSRWPEAESPLTDEAVEVTYAPAPGDRGTEVRVTLGGRSGLGDKLAALLGSDPQRRLDDALRRFKQVLETGEVVRSDGSLTGTDAKQQRNQQPAQPPQSAQ